MDYIKTKNLFSKRITKLRHIVWVESALFVVFFVMVIGGAILTAKALTYAFSQKNKTLNLGALGVKKLFEAKTDLLNSDFKTAQQNFSAAEKFFKNGSENINTLERNFFKLTNLFSQKNDAENILKASEEISQAGKILSEAFVKFDSLKLSFNGASGTMNFGEDYQVLENNFVKSLELLKNAEKKIKGVSKFREIKEQLARLSQSITALEFSVKTITAFKSFLVGNNNILLLFQNNNELRPTGGFLGSYGLLKISNGEIKKIKISSIYDLDGQLLEKIVPPTPILQVNPNWYMRDSNWFPDFPKSAKKILEFYEKEGGETPKLTVAITPNIVVDLLKITGPVSLPRYNLELNSENFIELTQVYTSVIESDEPLNEPKSMLSDFFVIFLQKLSEKNKESLGEILRVLYNSAKQKDLQFYSVDSKLSNYFSDLNFSGKIFTTDRDYLHINSANLSGTKTDLYIAENVKLKTKIDSYGKIVNELIITKKNTLPDISHSENLSFLRVYVPLGSKLLEAKGFSPVKIEKTSNNNQKTDSDVFLWEKSIVKELLSETIIGEESEKTFFGNWVKVLPGESQTVSLTYELPFKVKDIDRYSLLVQNQAGAKPINFVWDITLKDHSINWQNFVPKNSSANSLTHNFVLNTDSLFGLLLVKR